MRDDGFGAATLEFVLSPGFQVFGDHVGDHGRTTIAAAVLPLGACVEIDLVAKA